MYNNTDNVILILFLFLFKIVLILCSRLRVHTVIKQLFGGSINLFLIKQEIYTVATLISVL